MVSVSEIDPLVQSEPAGRDKVVGYAELVRTCRFVHGLDGDASWWLTSPRRRLYAGAIVSVRWMRPTDTLAADRDSTVVCVVFDTGQATSGRPGLNALAVLTPREIPLVLVGMRADDRIAEAAHELGRELLAIEPGQGGGSPLGGLAAASGAADLVLLDASARVPPGWIERLRDAARSDGAVATATPLGDDVLPPGSGAGVQRDPDSLVAAAANRMRPRLLIGGPHCLYVRRRALELIGRMTDGHETLAELTAALSTQCLHVGLVNVLADDLYVGCDRPSRPQKRAGGRLAELDRCDEPSPLTRSVQLAAAAVEGLSVTIDARSLGPIVGGTQRYTLELVLALARFTDLTVRAVVAHDIDREAAAELQDASGVEVIGYEQAVDGVAPSHIVHRPQQVFSTGDLNLLALLGRRVVITQQDLIAYHNPAYHETLEIWEQYRRITRQALAIADRVVFFSEHSRRDATAEDLVSPERCEIVGAAVSSSTASDRPTPPDRAPRDRDFILCLGADYRHKNRLFAIAVVQALRAQHDWRGQLVLAGGHVPYGSSRAEEEVLLNSSPAAREAVIDVGRVSDGERAWLLAQARAVIVPSVVEGFGLVPLEAAQAGVPYLFAAQSSLTEVINESLATLVAWDAGQSATRVMPLLLDGPQRERHLQLLQTSGQRWKWEQIAGALLGCYSQTMRSPYRPSAVRAWQEAQREHQLAEVERDHRTLLHHLGERIALASDEGFLTTKEQRGLLRVGSRPVLARAALWPFAALGAVDRARRSGS